MCCYNRHLLSSTISYLPGRRPGGGAAAFGAAGEEERCRDGGGRILAERAAHWAGERAAAPAKASRAAGRRARLRGQTCRILGTHTCELGAAHLIPPVRWKKTHVKCMHAVKLQLCDDVSDMFSMLFIACHTEHGDQPGAGALAAGGRAPPEGQRRGGTTACMLRGAFEFSFLSAAALISGWDKRQEYGGEDCNKSFLDWIKRFGTI